MSPVKPINKGIEKENTILCLEMIVKPECLLEHIIYQAMVNLTTIYNCTEMGVLSMTFAETNKIEISKNRVKQERNPKK